MFEKIKTIFAPAISIWDELPLPYKGLITTGLPFVAVLISASIAYYGNYQRQNLEADIQRKFKMVRAMSDVLNVMVNAETGMRGYLLTKRENFLEPYNQAKQNLPNELNELRSLAEAEPGEKPRAEKLEQIGYIQTLIEKQIADLDYQKNYVNSPDLPKSDLFSHLDYGKNLMDEIRTNLAEMNERESYLLGERISDINAIRRRDYITVFLVLFIGLIVRIVSFYLFRTSVLQRIVALTENVRLYKNGETYEFIKNKNDELGELEEELKSMAESKI